jgi:acyl-CoA thioester hydrolase
MLSVTTTIRVRYAETDQMGYVYYGNYAQYFEVGRVEALRSLGYTYRFMEESGVMMPVSKMDIKYLKPARYDDLLTIKTIIRELPSARMTFEYEITNELGDLLVVGHTTLVFVSMQTQRITRCPDFLLTALKPSFE